MTNEKGASERTETADGSADVVKELDGAHSRRMKSMKGGTDSDSETL